MGGAGVVTCFYGKYNTVTASSAILERVTTKLQILSKLYEKLSLLISYADCTNITLLLLRRIEKQRTAETACSTRLAPNSSSLCYLSICNQWDSLVDNYIHFYRRQRISMMLHARDFSERVLVAWQRFRLL